MQWLAFRMLLLLITFCSSVLFLVISSVQVLRILCKGVPLQEEGREGILESIADRTHGYAPSDLSVLLRISLEQALEK